MARGGRCGQGTPTSQFGGRILALAKQHKAQQPKAPDAAGFIKAVQTGQVNRQAPLTHDTLRQVMASKAYDNRVPEVVDAVRAGFSALYPGNVKRDTTGKAIPSEPRPGVTMGDLLDAMGVGRRQQQSSGTGGSAGGGSETLGGSASNDTLRGGDGDDIPADGGDAPVYRGEIRQVAPAPPAPDPFDVAGRYAWVEQSLPQDIRDAATPADMKQIVDQGAQRINRDVARRAAELGEVPADVSAWLDDRLQEGDAATAMRALDLLDRLQGQGVHDAGLSREALIVADGIRRNVTFNRGQSIKQWVENARRPFAPDALEEAENDPAFDVAGRYRTNKANILEQDFGDVGDQEMQALFDGTVKAVNQDVANRAKDHGSVPGPVSTWLDDTLKGGDRANSVRAQDLLNRLKDHKVPDHDADLSRHARIVADTIRRKRKAAGDKGVDQWIDFPKRQFQSTAPGAPHVLKGTTYFGGAGMEGADIEDFVKAFEEEGLENVRAADPSIWSGGAISDAVDSLIERNRDDEGSDLSAMGTDGEQFNLIGYSYGGIQAAQAAADYTDQGGIVDNVVFIGSTIGPELLRELDANPNIGSVYVVDLEEEGDSIRAGMETGKTISTLDDLMGQALAREVFGYDVGHFHYNSDDAVGRDRRRTMAKLIRDLVLK